MSKFGIKKIDLYISKKFIGTYFFAIALIISIAVVFDLSEKLDDFMEKEAPVKAIIFDYYVNFIPYFANLFSSLFTFIAVIFFTSKMAYNTEIIAILSSGVSFQRMMFPYFLSALLIFLFSYGLTGWVIPPANRVRLEFESQYFKKPHEMADRNIHKQIYPGEYVFVSSYNSHSNVGYNFTLERFFEGELKSKLTADYVKYDTLNKVWSINNYYIRHFDELNEHIEMGKRIDTTLNMKPDDFRLDLQIIGAMNNHELNVFIEEQKLQGSEYINEILVEKHHRLATPFSTFILTLIGVSLSSRKVRGGMGLHIGLGMMLSFIYILFQRFAFSFAINGGMEPLVAVWIPNSIFFLIGVLLYRAAPK